MTTLPLPPLLRCALAAGAALVLATACNDSGTPPAAPAPAKAANGPREVAMARGKIEVQGGLLQLSPLQDGLVQSVAVHEGQQVQRGQVLLRLAGDTLAADQTVAESELKLAQAKQAARAQRLPALRRTAARMAEAATAGAAEPQRAEEAQQALRDAESDLAVSAAEAQVAHSRLAQLRAQRARLELTAPENGQVVRLSTQAGQRWLPQSTEPAVTLLPQRPLIVRAELNESFAAQVHVGQRASVSTDGDTAAAALPPARVVRMSPIQGNGRLQDDAQRGPVRVVECVLEFDAVPNARIGQNVRVSFHD